VFNGLVYEAAQSHNLLPNWTPTQATNLWYRPTPSGIGAWRARTRYVVGSEVTFNGDRYRAITTHVSQSDWIPSITPTLWQRR